nr:hypothetical protein [Tanacetum cinerariifolium]
MKQARKSSKDEFMLQQYTKCAGVGSSITPENPDGPCGSSSSSSSSDDKIEDISTKEEKAAEEQSVDEQAGKVQAKVHVSETQIEKPAITLISSSMTLSLTEYCNQFLNDTIDVSLANVLKALFEAEPPSTSVDSLIEYELKLKLYNMMQNSRYFLDHEKHLTLYNALINSMDVEEANVKGNKDKKTRRHDKHDPPADADKDLKKRKRKDADTSSSKKAGVDDVQRKGTKGLMLLADAKKAKEEKAAEEQSVDEQAGKVQAKVHVSETQMEKPAITLISSSMTLSLTEYCNQFLNDTIDVSLANVLKALFEAEPPSTSVDSLIEYELKLKLYNMMQNSRYFLDHEKHLTLYNALINSMDVEEANVKGKTQSKSSKATKALTKPSATDKAIYDEELRQDDAMDDAKLVQYDDATDDEMTHDDVSPKQDRSKWFKQDFFERHEIPNP